MDCSITSTKRLPPGRSTARRAQHGHSTSELLIALGLGGLLLCQLCSLWFYTSRSFAAQASYVGLDQDSQRALDRLSKEIRQAKGLTSFAANEMVFKDIDDLPLAYSVVDRALVRIKGSQRTVLLTDCDWLKVSIFQRNPVEGSYDQYPAADVATCKLLELPGSAPASHIQPLPPPPSSCSRPRS
ncbi:MAG: hypothetical protein L0Y58_20235 [Verrucomicrobia subdivision 3 bacterium]|nr:hypothetical protein [Limisphaerales bacterium]